MTLNYVFIYTSDTISISQFKLSFQSYQTKELLAKSLLTFFASELNKLNPKCLIRLMGICHLMHKTKMLSKWLCDLIFQIKNFHEKTFIIHQN